MTQMESPKRKMQKKNDYQRHKLFRKIKRRRKAQAEAEQHIAERQLKKKLKIPKFGDGKGIKSETGAPLEVKDGMLYYKETGEPFHNAGLQLPEVEVVGDKSKVNSWAAAGRHNTSSYWDPNGVVHGFNKSVEAAIKYPAMIAEQNGYDTSRGTFTKAAKQHGMSVQSFANKVLKNPFKYSAAMRKKANFAHNAASWKH